MLWTAEGCFTHMCVYVPLTGSPYYNVTGTDNGIGILEECLAEVQLSSGVHVLLCGDLNARTANTPYEVNSSFQLLDVHCHKDTNFLTRNSEDSEENGYGKLLLNMRFYIRALYSKWYL